MKYMVMTAILLIGFQTMGCDDDANDILDSGPTDTESDSYTDMDTDTDTDTCTAGIWTSDDDFPVIADLDALEELTGYTSTDPPIWLRIQCPTCPNFEPLECLEAVGNGMRIQNCDLIIDMSGLEKLKMTGGLDVYDNDTLTSLNGLEGLEKIGDMLRIRGNPLLDNLEGLENLTKIWGGFTINNNPLLPYCEICKLIDHLEEAGVYAEIYDNMDDACWVDSELDCSYM